MSRNHAAKTLLRTTHASNRRTRSIRKHINPTARSSNIKASKVNTPFLLETASRAPGAAHLRPTATTAPQRAPPSLRRLRLAPAKLRRQHGRRHGHGRLRRTKPFRVRRLQQIRLRDLRRGVDAKALFAVCDERAEFRALVVAAGV